MCLPRGGTFKSCCRCTMHCLCEVFMKANGDWHHSSLVFSYRQPRSRKKWTFLSGSLMWRSRKNNFTCLIYASAFSLPCNYVIIGFVECTFVRMVLNASKFRGGGGPGETQWFKIFLPRSLIDYSKHFLLAPSMGPCTFKRI